MVDGKDVDHWQVGQKGQQQDHDNCTHASTDNEDGDKG